MRWCVYGTDNGQQTFPESAHQALKKVSFAEPLICYGCLLEFHGFPFHCGTRSHSGPSFNHVEYIPDADDEEYVPEETGTKRRGPPAKRKKVNKSRGRSSASVNGRNTAGKSKRTRRARSKTHSPTEVA